MIGAVIADTREMTRRPELCSVVIPTFNAGGFITTTVESALAETYTGGVEVIVVDDGSTDDTEERLAPYRDRIILATQPNRGPAAARNRALELAHGGFIALLDADDYWAPERIERLIAVLRSKPEIGLVTSDAFIVRDGEVTPKTFYETKPLPRRWFADQQRLILQNNFFFGSAVIRRELFDRHGNFDETRRGDEDWELWIRFLANGESLDILLEPLAYYRRVRGSLSEVPSDERGTQSAFLEHVLARPETQHIAGSAGILPYVRGVESLARGDGRAAAEHFKAALQQRDLPAFRRTKARIGVIVPGLSASLFRAWRWLRRRSRV